MYGSVVWNGVCQITFLVKSKLGDEGQGDGLRWMRTFAAGAVVNVICVRSLQTITLETYNSILAIYLIEERPYYILG